MQPGVLEIREERDGARCTIALAGELDLITAPMLERAATAALDGGIGELVLDVRELTFLDSTGFRAVLAVKDVCLEQGVGFAMTRGPESVQRVFAISGVLKRLPFV